MESTNQPTTLGQYLEQGRQRAELSYRQCATAAGIPLTTVMRLFKDEVENPQADHVQQLARVLELDESDAFAYIGVTPPKGLPDVTAYLRAKHKLKGETLHRAAQEVQGVINKYDGAAPDE